MFAFERPADSLEHAASLSRTRYYWYIYGGNDYSNFDFSFEPPPWESDFVHTWPSQWQPDGEVYLAAINNSGQKHYHNTPVHRLPNLAYWDIPEHIDPTSIDQRWSPDPLDPPINYHFPVQWNWDNIGGPVYRVPGATDDKYVGYFTAKTRADMSNWHIPANIKLDSFDFSWRPHPKDPPYIYKFPTVWNSEGGPEYRTPNATEEKYIADLVAESLPDTTPWTVPEEVNADSVDFSWVPHPKDPPYIYHFGSDYQASVGLTYTVTGASEIKFAGPIPSRDRKPVLEVLDIFFIDKNNPLAQPRYDRLAERHAVTKVRYANSILDTIRRCVNKARTNKFWIISSEYDYSNFDFAWHAEPWQNYMTHVFPSQHNRWSDTFLINRWEFERHSEWATGLEQFPNLNFVTNQSVTKTENLHNIYYVDHANPESRIQYELLKKFEPDIILTRFANTYLDTMKRIMATADTEYVWILNSICNYDFFDFTWQPEPWQKEMIHCFANSNGIVERRGDTFYIHVESFRKQMVELELLDWFNVINYNNFPFVQRWPTPVVYYGTDNLIAAVQKHTFETPYVLFTNQPDIVDPIANGSSNCLWSDKDRTAVTFIHSRATTLVPREIKRYLKTQIYDYPYLEKDNSQDFFAERPLDIVYISNGEPDEERYYRNLEDDVYGNPLRDPRHRIKWVRGVDGRVAAYQAAAKQSSTDWFFAVFAKLEVDGVDWTWQPDYWQQPKHYIFNAHNPVNGLEYGHMGMIAYNKNLVLANNAPGIDFTLSQPHESVPILSGTAHFNQDAWTTWRTAFREVLKLRLFMATQPTLETEHRLNTWLSTAQGNYSDYCLSGARDAVEYYESVAGDAVKLQLSFDWRWLRDRYDAKY